MTVAGKSLITRKRIVRKDSAEGLAELQRRMNPDLAAAIVASAYNQSAAIRGNESMRDAYPSGMRPADVPALPHWKVRHILQQWMDVYSVRQSARDRADALYTPAEFQCALDFFSTPIPGTVGAL